MFPFLLKMYHSRMAFDPNYPVIDMNNLKECKWEDLNKYLKEAIPPNAPEERGE